MTLGSRAPKGRYDGLADLARGMPHEPSSMQLVQGWQRIRSKSSSGRSGRLLLANGFALAALAAIAGIFAYRSLHTSEPTLSYVVDGGTRATDGSISSGEASPSTVRFSDGTELALSPHARASVGLLGVKEAHVTLEDGHAQVNVHHRDNARWLVGAGPFTIAVTGTSFDVAWIGNDQLEVKMRTGSVTVKGPLVEDGRNLSAGEVLRVRLNAHDVSVEDSSRETGALSPVALAPEPDRAGEPSARAPTSSVDRAPSAAPRGATSSGFGWSSMLARGKVADIVSDAESRGVDVALAQATSDDLAALSDAARYIRQTDLARRALQTQRARFPRSAAARDAAFFLGRLDETSGSSSAMSWYQRYLDEAPDGSYAGEALGREMGIVMRVRGKAQAQPLAEKYLAKFPNGAYAPSARSLLGRP